MKDGELKMEDNIDYGETDDIGWLDFLDKPITYGVLIFWAIGIIIGVSIVVWLF